MMSADQINFERWGPGYGFGERRPMDPYYSKGRHWVKPNSAYHENMTPQERNYSYDEFFIWGNNSVLEKEPNTSAVYSDRFTLWGRDKLDEHFNAHLKDKGGWQAPLDCLSAFMSAYNGKPTQVIAVAEGCNCATGYPYWILWFKDAEPSESE